MKSQQKDRATVVDMQKIMTKSGIKRLVKLFDHKCEISQLKAARQMKCTQLLVDWTLKNKTTISKRT